MRTLTDFGSNEDAIFLAVLGGMPLEEFRKLWQENRAAGYDDGWQTGMDQAQDYHNSSE